MERQAVSSHVASSANRAIVTGATSQQTQRHGAVFQVNDGRLGSAFSAHDGW
jgi:hypothetical protein